MLLNGLFAEDDATLAQEVTVTIFLFLFLLIDAMENSEVEYIGKYDQLLFIMIKKVVEYLSYDMVLEGIGSMLNGEQRLRTYKVIIFTEIKLISRFTIG